MLIFFLLLIQLSKLEILSEQLDFPSTYIAKQTSLLLRVRQLHLSSLQGDKIDQFAFNVRITNDTTESIRFDVFYLSQDDYDCYCFQVLADKQWSYECEFLKNPEQYVLNQKELQIDLLQNKYQFILIDNTPFPPEGATFDFDIQVSQSYHQEVSISQLYYMLNFILGCCSAVCLVLVVTLIVIFYKLRRRLRKLKEESSFYKFQKNLSAQRFELPQSRLQSEADIEIQREPRSQSPDRMDDVVSVDSRRNMSDALINGSGIKVRSFGSDKFKQPNIRKSKFFD